MFALYHLNSGYWSCQEWIAVAQSWAERNLFYCVIFPPQTEFFCKQISKSSAPVSHADRGRRRKKKRMSSGLPRSFLCPNRAVSQTIRRENGRYFPPAAARRRPLLNRQTEGKEILLLCPWAMLNCCSKTDTGLRPCFMAAIEMGRWRLACWLGRKDGCIERKEVGWAADSFSNCEKNVII